MHQATFLHYLYQPGVKEKLLATVRQQMHVVLDHIDKPENVVGFTFLEELPGHFSSTPFRNPADAKVPWDLERFGTEIEAERGAPLRWDSETKRWWGRKWVQVIDEIHAVMKAEAGDRLIFYWLQTNRRMLDELGPGESPEQAFVVPHRWSDIVKPGYCDGFFAYPNNEAIWTDRYLRLAKDNVWPFFSQVSHPSFARLCTWDTAVKLAQTKIDQNLGYFFFCLGDCAAGYAWNADRTMPPAAQWHVAGYAPKLHVRRHLAEQNVGMDVVRRYPPLRLRIELPLAGAQPGQEVGGHVIVQNAREASFFLDPDEAVVRDVAVTIEIPQADRRQASGTRWEKFRWPMGVLKPGQFGIINWGIKLPADFSGSLDSAVKIVGEAAGCAPTIVEVTQDSAISNGEARDVSGGEQWIETTYRTSGQPSISIEALRDGVSDPRVGHERGSVGYRGTLSQGERVVFDAGGGARLLVSPLLDDDGAARSAPDDPTGFGAFVGGYAVSNILVGRDVTPGQPLKIRIAGQVSGGAESQLVLRYHLEDGRTSDQATLVNQFSQAWRQVSQTVTVPQGAASLQNVFLYRRGDRGKVWYGPVFISRADVPPDGRDVTDRILGRFPRVSPGGVHVVRYTDGEEPFTGTRARVHLMWAK